MKMNRTVLLIISFMTACFFEATAQTVSDADFRQEGNKVIVTYTLDKTADIYLFVSTDGGKTFKGPLKHVSGDAGKSISPGRRSITWDPISESGGISGSNICFKIKAQGIGGTTDARNSLNVQVTPSKKERIIHFGIGFGAGSMISGDDPAATYYIPVEMLLGRNNGRVQFSIGETFSFTENIVQFSTIGTIKAKLLPLFYFGAGGGFNANVYTDEEGFLEEISGGNDINGLPAVTGLVLAEAGINISGFDVSLFYKYDFYRVNGQDIPGSIGCAFKYYF